MKKKKEETNPDAQKNASTGPKRLPIERERDMLEIQDMYLKGKTMLEIAKHLSSVRKYTLSHVTIKRDIDEIVKRWREDLVSGMDTKQAVEISKLNKVESEAWIRYDEDHGSKWLEVVLKCIEKRCRIFGLEEQTETYSERQIIIVSLPSADEDASSASDETQEY